MKGKQYVLYELRGGDAVGVGGCRFVGKGDWYAVMEALVAERYGRPVPVPPEPEPEGCDEPAVRFDLGGEG